MDGRQAHCGPGWVGVRPLELVRMDHLTEVRCTRDDACDKTGSVDKYCLAAVAQCAGTGFVARTRFGLRQDSPHPGGNSKGQTQSGFRAKRIATDAPSGTCKLSQCPDGVCSGAGRQCRRRFVIPNCALSRPKALRRVTRTVQKVHCVECTRPSRLDGSRPVVGGAVPFSLCRACVSRRPAPPL
jgi:hypothetical protein